MFIKITDFKRKRTIKEAIGFYIAYAFLFIMIFGLIGGIAGDINLKDLFFRYDVLQVIGIIMCLILSFLILQKKKLTGNFGLILVAIASGILAFFGNGLFGLIPAAYLTTR